ncbi:MAG: tyrosine-type recombinase/integrase [Acidobacteriota bacterium]
MPYKDRGKWRAVVTINGKRYTESDPSWSKRDAQKWEIETRKRLLTASHDMDWLTLAVKYLDFAETKYSRNTYVEKKTLVGRFSKFLGKNLPVAEVSPQHIQDYLLVQTRERSNNCANRDRKNLHAMWEWGQKILDIPTNPIAKTEKFAHHRGRIHVPTEEDILAIYAVATAKERAFLDCYLCTAARRSEIFRLTWEDVNFEHRTITIRHHKSGDGSEKTNVLPMNQRLYESLMWWWKSRLIKDSEFVWVCEEGPHAGQPYTFRRRFLKGLCKRAEVKEFGFHSLRRYAATMLSDKFKVSTKTIQRILGHESVTTTERYLYNAHKDLEGVMELMA